MYKVYVQSMAKVLGYGYEDRSWVTCLQMIGRRDTLI